MQVAPQTAERNRSRPILDDLVVIAAGSDDHMAKFLAANPGLARRFAKTIHFTAYTDDELVAIFNLMAGALPAADEPFAAPK